ncbi:hypothetical protein Trichorick_01015 [Candidatus Trichorickettsia mobilis]|uniref:Uncharacterized protein n=1 Tax=Candidatus Trichorickettsia mobilis TaxID=1346319 RepID=A0ABZ0UTK3_9RICK|nr:hypothetical protein [Candidatus Trichorickettsia mobilis]WPY01116.1 hypothetical protein Trichorick_01015 [Candidatus Trichorickettsia mobilis]
MKSIYEYNQDIVKKVQADLQIQKAQLVSGASNDDKKKGSLPLDFLSIKHGLDEGVGQSNFNQYNAQGFTNFEFKKPETTKSFVLQPLSQVNSGLLQIVADAYRRGDKTIKLTESTLNQIRIAVQDSSTSAAQDAIFIISKAVEKGENIPADLMNVASITNKLNYGSNNIIPTQKSYNPQIIAAIASGFQDDEIGVTKFNEITLNQLRAVLTDPSAGSKVKQDAIFIVTEALKKAGKPGAEELVVPNDLVKLAGIAPQEQNIQAPINIYKNLESIAKLFESGKNIKLTAKTVELIKSALQQNALPQSKQYAADIVFAAFGEEGQELITEELVELAQNIA